MNTRAIGRVQGIMVIVVLLVAVAGAVYFYSTMAPPSTTTSASTTGSSGSTGPLPTSLVVEEESQPDSMDPAVTYVTPGWEIVEQVYQGLVAPDRGSLNTYIGVLAQNWTTSPDGMTYTFNLRPNIAFSNGDPFNAYAMWFSIYRTLLMNQGPAFIIGQNLAPGNHMNFNITDQTLNSINYANPSPKDLTYLTYPNQSVEVRSPSVLVIHLGYGTNGIAPYHSFLATLSTPVAMAVDPKVVIANGGVVAGTTNNWMVTHALGTSFYQLQAWVQGQSVTLVRNPNYWGANVPPSQSNYAVQPATIDTINFYYKPTSTMIADLKSNTAQIIKASSSQYSVLNQVQGVTASIMPTAFGSSEGVYVVYMDPYAFAPFQDVRVREAIANAFDYQSIIHAVLNDLGTQWIGPVPPGFPYYNESIAGLQPYSYDPVKSARLLAAAGYLATLPNGTTLNALGKKFPSVNFLYNADDAIESRVAEVISAELHSVGIDIALTPLTSKQYSNVIFSSSNLNSTMYPFGIGTYSEDYTASDDYVTAITANGYLGFSGYMNATVKAWSTAAATALDEGTIVQNFRAITQAMYYSYTDVWLYVPYFMAANRSNVAGMIPNPAGSAAGYFMFYNTVHYTS